MIFLQLQDIKSLEVYTAEYMVDNAQLCFLGKAELYNPAIFTFMWFWHLPPPLKKWHLCFVYKLQCTIY